MAKKFTVIGYYPDSDQVIFAHEEGENAEQVLKGFYEAGDEDLNEERQNSAQVFAVVDGHITCQLPTSKFGEGFITYDSYNELK